MEDLSLQAQEWVVAVAPGVIGAILVLVLGWLVARLTTSGMRRMLNRANIDATLTGFVSNIGFMTLMVLVVITALGQLGINTTSFAAIVGAAGLAIGFALQGSLANFAAGVMLILFRPFKAGDFIEAAGVAGVVEEVQVFATKILSVDNKEITLPNGQITSGAITNYSARDTRRIDLVFGIGYCDDITTMKSSS